MNSTVLQLPEHHGFTYAVKAALELVKTEYVMVIQHDREFERSFSLKEVIKALKSDEAIKMVSLMSTSTLDHAKRLMDRSTITPA
jgi:hypothetical protein